MSKAKELFDEDVICNMQKAMILFKEDTDIIKAELDYAEKCHNLEEEIGCPLEVRCKVVKNTSIFAELGYRKISNEWLVSEISSVYFICWQKCAVRRYFWKDYKKTWWLKKDKSE